MLSVRDLGVAFGAVQPLSGVSFDVGKGETLGIVGESGSGKSLTAMSVMGLLPLIGGRITGGSIAFDGKDLTHLSERAYRKLRGGKIGLITQNPMTSLDPLQKIGPQVDDVAQLHLGMDAAEARARTVDILRIYAERPERGCGASGDKDCLQCVREDLAEAIQATAPAHEETTDLGRW